MSESLERWLFCSGNNLLDQGCQMMNNSQNISLEIQLLWKNLFVSFPILLLQAIFCIPDTGNYLYSWEWWRGEIATTTTTTTNIVITKIILYYDEEKAIFLVMYILLLRTVGLPVYLQKEQSH